MHESEWLPRLLLKSDLLHICNLFNLSIDGFRKDKLSTRPVEQLRGVVTSALVRGIGTRKAIRGKIPMHLFYAEIAEDAKEQIPENWKSLSFEEIAVELDLCSQLRIYQKIAIIYEWHNDQYTEHSDAIKKNAVEKKPLFQGIFNINEDEMVNKAIMRIGNGILYPTVDEYTEFIESIGANEKWEAIKARLDENENERSKLNYIASLNSFDRFLAVIAMLPEQERLQQIAFSMYLEEKENLKTEAFKQVKMETVATNEQCSRLMIELEQAKEKNHCLQDEIVQLTDKILTTDKALTFSKAELQIVKNERENERQKRIYAEKIKELFEELVPLSIDAIIVTDSPDPRIKEVFSKSIFSKNFLLKEKQNGTIFKLKNKVWFIDRQSFKNTQDWLHIKNFLNENEFYFEEYNDYIELLKQYIQVIEKDITEEYVP
ncbi:putative nucleic acid-binding Zn-ribbon protein [Paenibacillus forsythiae]|uniref:Nucleic acid-binding Zn-ribbon protein n=1 Tax=Paenibacillus forsythiae TaxID=365616 RepID=A0ABU3H4A3_9BACL|nr:hypothetical protein [Paenibacillus forsythiae]MDT3425281.1 putative nucleic acid-binding Zn-ribbon protein [Paenibacillus forsythiae]